MINETILKNEEKAVFTLRSIYRKFGYLPYKMGKFEEYDFYVKNKDFLISDRVITFNDTNGKLMALKPDVTLSIIKNHKDEPGTVQRVYYNENVYRISESTNAYKEIMQAGLECFGEIDIYNKLEVLNLATESLAAISDEFVLEISHMGILSGLLNASNGDSEFKKLITACVGEKNAHEIPRICAEFNVSGEVCNKLMEFVDIYGSRTDVLKRLEKLCEGDEMHSALQELRMISNAMESSPYSENILFDFSIVSNMKYYNGVLFRGFINGIPESVLSGGQYDNLMKKIGRGGGAIGFAVYLDLLENLKKRQNTYDVDVVLVYSDDDSMEDIRRETEALNAAGLTVSVQRNIPESLNFRQVIRMSERSGK